MIHFFEISSHCFLVVGRRTAFEVDWLLEKTLHIFYGNESFSSLVSANNDFFNDRLFLLIHHITLVIFTAAMGMLTGRD